MLHNLLNTLFLLSAVKRMSIDTTDSMHIMYKLRQNRINMKIKHISSMKKLLKALKLMKVDNHKWSIYLYKYFVDTRKDHDDQE